MYLCQRVTSVRDYGYVKAPEVFRFVDSPYLVLFLRYYIFKSVLQKPVKVT